MASDNRRKALGEVISLEAWHEPFSKADKKVDLFVDVAFTTGRLGGEEGSEVRFILGLRAAEVVVIVPPGEPAKVDRGSVKRDAPSTNVKLTASQATHKKTKAKGSASSALSNLKAKIAASGTIEGEVGAAEETRIAVTEAVQNMRLLHTLGADGNHRWTVSAVGEDPLHGRPWVSEKKPRLKVIDQRSDRTTGLAPVITVEIRCRREDLVISNIELKDLKGFADRVRRDNRRNREAAAQAVIRTRLFEEGLLGGDNEDRYAVMVLASIMAESD
jgi:hypothetical protein